MKDGLEGPILTGPDGKRSSSEDIEISLMKDLVQSGRHLDPVVAYLVATARTFALSNGRCLRGLRTRNAREHGRPFGCIHIFKVRAHQHWESMDDGVEKCQKTHPQ